MPTAVIDLTEIVRLAMRRPERSRLFQAWEARRFVWAISPAVDHPSCRDSKDDIVVATAVSAHPCFLVTSDRDLYDDAGLVDALHDLKVDVIQPGKFLSAL